MTQPPPSRLRPFSPMRFGRYTLVARLAQGGMGELFLAQLDGGGEGFQKLCVIKRMLPQLAHDPEFVERFTNEARVLVKLSHGAIAQVLELGTHEGTPFLALEYVDGKDLRRISARARELGTLLPPGFVLQVMCRVLEALAYAHRKKDDQGRELLLVHRDISPPNVLVSYEGEVKVIDFGLARSRLSAARTNPRSLLGKFLYMSPEQARHRVVDRRSDLYAVGLCLYELLAGAHPFERLGPAELMSRVAEPAIPHLRTVLPACPAPLADVVMRALAPEPEARYQSADELRVALFAQLASVEPAAGAEQVARVMHRLFGPEFQLERRLLAAAREPQSLPTADSRARSATAVLPATDGAGAAPSSAQGPGQAPAIHPPVGSAPGQPAWTLQATSAPGSESSRPPPLPPGSGSGPRAGLTGGGGASRPPGLPGTDGLRSVSGQAFPRVGGAQSPPLSGAREDAWGRGDHAPIGASAVPPQLPGASAADAAPRTIVDRSLPGAPSGHAAGVRGATGSHGGQAATLPATPPPLPTSASRPPSGRGIAAVGPNIVAVPSDSGSGAPAARTPARVPPIAGGSSRSVPAVPVVSPFGGPSESTAAVPSISSDVVTLVPGRAGVRGTAPRTAETSGVAAQLVSAPVVPAGASESATRVPGGAEVRGEASAATPGGAWPRTGQLGAPDLHLGAELDAQSWVGSESARTELTSFPGPAASGIEEDALVHEAFGPTRKVGVQASALSFEPTPRRSDADLRSDDGGPIPSDLTVRRPPPSPEVLQHMLDEAFAAPGESSSAQSGAQSGAGTPRPPQPSAWSDEVTTGTGGLSAGFAPPSVAPLHALQAFPPPPPERALQDFDSAEFLIPTEEETLASSELEPSTAAALAAWFEAEPGAVTGSDFPADSDSAEAPAGAGPGGSAAPMTGDVERAEAAFRQAERAQAERVQAERAQAERVQAERVQADRVQADRVQAERAQAERMQAEREQAERAQAERAQAERAQAERAQAERAQAEREQAERAQAERAQAEQAQAERSQAERSQAGRRDTSAPETRQATSGSAATSGREGPASPSGQGFDVTAAKATSPWALAGDTGPSNEEAPATMRRGRSSSAAGAQSVPSSRAARSRGNAGLDDLLHEATTQKGAIARGGPDDPDATDPSYRLSRPDPDDLVEGTGRGAGLWWGLAVLVLLGVGAGAGWEWGRQHPERVPAALAVLYPVEAPPVPAPATSAPASSAPSPHLEAPEPTPEPAEAVPVEAPGELATLLKVDTLADANTLLVPLRAERGRGQRTGSVGAPRLPPGVLGREWAGALELFEKLESEQTCEGSLSLMCKRFARVQVRVEAATTDDPSLRRQVRELKRALRQMER